MTQPPYQQQPYQGPGPYQQQAYQQQPAPGQYQAPYQQPQQQQQPPQYGQHWGQPPQQAYQQPQQQYQQQQYQGQQYQAPQYQQQQAGHQAYGGQSCRLCGSAPAVQATFRAVVGAVFMHTIWTAPGPYCRDCGLHTFRRQTAKSLTGGWCSIGAIVLTPIFVLMNLSSRSNVAKLPAPQPQGDGRAPLDPGPPVFQRPGAYLYPGLAFLLVILIIIGNLSS
ncbi:hypothetical protein [Actinoallomurus oryzae]|uniref:hypothetical protein n=1 Tax=Actinoallomurus oryzae TaxID=502180 RepID=UPI0031F13869